MGFKKFAIFRQISRILAIEIEIESETRQSFRAQKKLDKVDLIMKDRRLRWLVHFLRIDVRLAKTSSAFSKAKTWRTKEKLDRHYTSSL